MSAASSRSFTRATLCFDCCKKAFVNTKFSRLFFLYRHKAPRFTAHGALPTVQAARY
jgi:hypothetical protein